MGAMIANTLKVRDARSGKLKSLNRMTRIVKVINTRNLNRLSLREENMTINEIKEQLPDVKVNVNGKIETCQIAGRKLDYPSVYTSIGRFEYSWQAIERAINDNTALKV